MRKFEQRHRKDSVSSSCFGADESLISEASTLADGADVHSVAGLVAMYRCLVKEGLCAAAEELERELRGYVVRKRQQRCVGTAS